jgi:uncharacterized protein involved in exopolysaccharide biosynthesis
MNTKNTPSYKKVFRYISSVIDNFSLIPHNMSESLNFLKPYLRGWPLIFIAMLGSFLIASKYLTYVTPMYESTAKLHIANIDEGVPAANLFKDLDVFVSSQKINSEIEILLSHTIIEKALKKVDFGVQIFREGNIKKTELYYDSPFLVEPINWNHKQYDYVYTFDIHEDFKFSVVSQSGRVVEGTLGDTILLDKSLVAFHPNTELLELRKDLHVVDRYNFSVLSREKQIQDVISKLDIIAVEKDVPVIRISYRSSNPLKASEFPNVLAETYIEDYIENKFQVADATVNFLNDRINEVSRKLAESELTILKYRDEQSITNIRQETETELRKISQLKIQQTNLKMSLEAIRELEQYIEQGKDNFLELAPNFEAFTDLLSTEIIKNIKQLQSEKKDLLLEYTENDERVIVIDAKIQDLTSYLAESIKNTRKNLQTKYEKLSLDIQEAEKAFVDVPEKERMMTILNREFEIFQQSYNFLNQKRIEAEIAKAAKIAFHRVITPSAISKKPISPNTIIIKIVSVILGMMGAIIFIFFIHSLKARVNDAQTIESSSMTPIIAKIPKFTSASLADTFFVKTLAEWEVNKFVKPQSIIVCTAFNKNEGSKYLFQQLQRLFTRQKRKTLSVLFDAETEFEDGSFMTEKEDANGNVEIVYMEKMLQQVPIETFQQSITEIAQSFDQTLILNTCFDDVFTVSVMAIADLNVVSLDTRLTPAKNIVEADLIKEKFSLPNFYFAVNRFNYTPSLFKEIAAFFRNKKSKANVQA